MKCNSVTCFVDVLVADPVKGLPRQLGFTQSNLSLSVSILRFDLVSGITQAICLNLAFVTPVL